MPSERLVLVKTGGNQRYIFETNRLAEVVGASELVRLSTEDWAKEILKKQEFNGRLTELVISSGQVLLRATDRGAAADFVHQLTLKALVEAPGLEMYSAISEPFDFEPEMPAAIIHRHIAEIHRSAETNRFAGHPTSNRFKRIPPVADCASADLPAAHYGRDRKTIAARSHSVWAKLGWANNAKARIGNADLNIEQIETSFDEGENWIAVIHADGNGLGQIFTAFDSHLPPASTAADYVVALQAFSKGIDRVTKSAVETAVASTWSDPLPPVVPVLLGGDDLTLICEGARAVPFVNHFLGSLGELSKAEPAITAIMGSGLTAAAGVVLTKPHFPFSDAYQIAEALLVSAKEAKLRTPGYSSFDVHVLYDTIGSNLDAIRRRMMGPDKIRLWGGPYVVGIESPKSMWADAHASERLTDAVAALAADDDEGRRRLASSQTHKLRTALRKGAASANSALGTAWPRLLDSGPDASAIAAAITFNGDLSESRSLFGADRLESDMTDEEKGKISPILTRFLDALTLSDIERDAARSKSERSPQEVSP